MDAEPIDEDEGFLRVGVGDQVCIYIPIYLPVCICIYVYIYI